MESIRHWRTGRKLTVAHSRSGIRVHRQPLGQSGSWASAGLADAGAAPGDYANDRFRGRTPEDDAYAESGLGHYCDLQSLNSEDTATFSFFGTLACLTDEERRDTTGLIFERLGLPSPVGPVTTWVWRRLPHPEKVASTGGPEIDFGLLSADTLVLGESEMELAGGRFPGGEQGSDTAGSPSGVPRGARPQGVARSPPVGRSRRRQAPGSPVSPGARCRDNGRQPVLAGPADPVSRLQSAPNSKTTSHGRVNSRLQARNIVRSRRACSGGSPSTASGSSESANVLRGRLRPFLRLRRALRVPPPRVPSRPRTRLPVRPARRDAVRHPHGLGHAPHGRRGPDEDETGGMGPVPRIVGERRRGPEFLAARHPARIVRTRVLGIDIGLVAQAVCHHLLSTIKKL